MNIFIDQSLKYFKSNFMKKISYIFLLIEIMFVVKTASSQSLIAVQNDSGSAFYTTLDQAITGASSGDYIYLPGGSFPVTVPISKKLHIIGVGHNPDSCAVTGITQVTGSLTIKAGSDHGSIVGIKFSVGITFTVSVGESILNDYSIERCNFPGISIATRTTNILISECVINGSINGSNSQIFQLLKCIVTGAITAFDKNTYFINNVFLSNGTYNIYAVNDCYFRNNIFTGKLIDLAYAGGNNPPPMSRNNLFQNNIFNNGFSLGTTYVSGTTTYVYNVFQNNITGPVTPLFTNQSGNVFDYKQDYHILPASVAHNAGTDGTDLGIYGTGNPWKEGSLPDNPHIQSKSISTVNGALNVKVKAAAQDY